MRRSWYHPNRAHYTMYPSTGWNKHFLHAMYFRCYNNYMIEENDKLMFYFLSPNVVLLFVFKIASWNVFSFLRNSVLCIWLSNKGIQLLKILLFLANKGSLLLKLKHVRNVWYSSVYILLNKYFCCTVFKNSEQFWRSVHVFMSSLRRHALQCVNQWEMNRNDYSV